MLLADQLRKFLPPAHLLVLTSSAESSATSAVWVAALWPGKEKRGRKGNFKSSLKSVKLPRQLIKLTTLIETAHCKQQPNKAASSQMADDQATAATGGGEGESAHKSLSESLAACIPAGLDKCCCQSMMGATNQLLSPQHPCCSYPGWQRPCTEQCNLCASVQAGEVVTMAIRSLRFLYGSNRLLCLFLSLLLLSEVLPQGLGSQAGKGEI